MILDKPFYSAKEVAELFGVHPNTLCKKAKAVKFDLSVIASTQRRTYSNADVKFLLENWLRIDTTHHFSSQSVTEKPDYDIFL